VIRYSAYSGQLLPALELPQRKLLVYHNVTPPRYMWNHHAGVAVACALGRAQMRRFARAADVAVGDSEHNAAELRAAGAPGARALPILFDEGRLGDRGAPPAGEGPLVLVVSRLAPNKRHDLAIGAFAAWQAEHAPEARMLCVGEPLSPAFGQTIEAVAARSGAANVTIAGGLSQADLNAAYAAADVLLSMSEHEGFSVPLLEAFHFGLPVVARPAGAMPEVGGDAVLWDEDDDLAVTAELIELAVRDRELREELAARGRARLGTFSYERTAGGIMEAVEEALR
jgi:L-malate glycosyltransferase